MTAADGMQVKENAAPIAAGRRDIETQEGIQMHHNLTSDDLEVEIGELIAQYRAGSDNSAFGLLALYKSPRADIHIEARIHVDARFSGEAVTASSRGSFAITAHGADLFEALRNVRNAFVASAPSVEIVKGD